MSTLAIPSVELCSMLRAAPLNGPPTSENYNDSQQEQITDLATLSSFINDTLLPILNGLGTGAATGLEGSSIFGDTTDQTQLFYNATEDTPLCLSDSLRVLYNILTNYQTQLTTMNSQVLSLSSQLAATNQTDIALAINGITTSISTLQGMLDSQQASIVQLQTLSKGTTIVRPVSPAAGTQYFDTTLNKPVWWSGTAWLNAEGVAN